jgi:hypothetical protein
VKTKPQHKMKRLLTKASVLFTAASLLAFPLTPSVLAGKEGLFLNDSVYFTLDGVTLSSGSDNGSLRFTLELNNGSNQVIDFNDYGVKVVNEDGTSYSARLSAKGEARVKANQKQDFTFLSEVPLEVKPEQLKVDIFRWDKGSSSYVQDIGALSVGAATQSNQTANQQILLNANEIDSTLPIDSLLSLELGKSYRVFTNGVWNVYVDLWVQNIGSTSYKLPTALQYNLKDKNNYQFAATPAFGGDATLLPGETAKLTLQSSVSSSLNNESLVLQLSKKSQTDTVVLGAMNIGASLNATKLNDKIDYPALNAKGVKISTSWTSVSKQVDGLHVQSNVTISNEGDEVLSTPALSAEYQTVKGSLAVTSTDTATRQAYLSPGESTTYHFSGVLPSNLDTQALQLVVLEKKAAAQAAGQQQGTQANANSSSLTLPVLLTALAGANSGTDSTPYTSAQSYTLGEPLRFNNNNLIDSNMDVSLVEMHMHENDDFGYKTVVAKYKLTNKGTSSLPVPDFQADLTSSLGYSYTGTKQTTAAKQILPNTSYVLSYSYMMPPSEAGEQLAMNLYDTNHSAIGSYKVALQSEATDGPISFYPFTLELKDYDVSATYSSGTYNYKVKLNLDIERKEQVIVDSNFSQVSFELTDAVGQVIGTQTMAFTGAQKLVSGTQTINFNGAKIDQIQSGVSIKMYELIQTPNGPVKRLVKVLDL